MERLVVALVVASCSSGSSSVPVLTGGSRLAPMWFETASGQQVAPAAGNWFDTDLGIPCTVERADDGLMRCVPRTFTGVFIGQQMFADAECMQPANFNGSPPPSETCASTFNMQATGWATGPGAPVACSDYPWVPILEMLAPNPDAFVRQGGACVLLGKQSFGYTTGAPVPATSFVAFADAAPIDASGRLRALARVGSDGSRELGEALWDDARGERCSAVDSGDGITRCIPDGASVFLFLDAACTQPIAYQLAPTCSEVARAAVVERREGGVLRMFELGPMITPPVVYSNFGGCRVFDPTGATLHEIGAEIPLTAFAPLTDIALTSGRIVEHGWADADGNLLVRGVRLHDTELAVDVEPMTVDTRRVELWPTSWATITHFADPACNVPLVEASEEPGLAVLETLDDEGCSARRTFAVEGEVFPAEIFQRFGDTCGAASLPRARLFVAGAELSRAHFVDVDVKIR